MRNIFENESKLSEAERALRAWEIPYKKQKDDSLVVRSLVIKGKGLTQLPNLTRVIVEGDFDCSDNQLTSLAGAPKACKGTFDCSNNQLISLKGAPDTGYNFICSRNRLTSLEGARNSGGVHFDCSDNLLTSLRGAPENVWFNFTCANNRLTTLEGGPWTVHGMYDCTGNPLASLAGLPQGIGERWCFAPKNFTTGQALHSDFGNFRDRSDVPETLRPRRTIEERPASLEMRFSL